MFATVPLLLLFASQGAALSLRMTASSGLAVDLRGKTVFIGGVADR